MKWILLSILNLQIFTVQAIENQKLVKHILEHEDQIMDNERTMQMKQQTNIQLVQKLLKGMLDPANISNYDEFFADNIRMHGPFNGYEGDINLRLAKEFDAWLAKNFRKEKMDIQEIFTHEDKVIVYWVLHGAIPQTGKKHMTSGTSMYRINGGKICEIWQSWDTSSLAQVLGNDPDFSSPQAFLEGTKTDPITLFGLEEHRKLVESLSDREVDCLQQLLLGKTAIEIGQFLHLSPRTVESYLENLKEKLSCDSKRELFSRAQLFSRLKLI
jgi:DNA-binding CsgD family transcriptional regulator/predicted SnoaL-like aldol condensation-catalyzing enzyme